MSFIVDLIIIAIFALCIFIGYKRGLTGSLIKILSFVISLAIALVLFKPVSNFIVEKTQVDETIKNSIIDIFNNEENTKEQQEKNQEQTTIAEPIVEYVNEQIEQSTNQIKEEVVSHAANEIAIITINIVVIIALLIIARIVLLFVEALTELLTKLPVIKQFDKGGGIIYGILQSLIIIFITLAIISFISTITADYTIAKLIGQSYIGKILYNNNLLLEIVF